MQNVTLNAAGIPIISIPYSAFLATRIMKVEDFLSCQIRYQQFQAYLQNATGVAVSLNQIPNAFTFQTVDLLSALGIALNGDQDINEYHVRGYFGLDENNNMKILFVVAVGANLNVTPQIAGQDAYFVWSNDDTYQAFVLDLNYPCPPLCPGSAS